MAIAKNKNRNREETNNNTLNVFKKRERERGEEVLPPPLAFSFNNGKKRVDICF